MRYVRVKVKRDTNTVHNSLVSPWEVPVLEYIFEDGNVEELEEHEENAREYPDAPAEFGRLVKAYGADPKTGIPYVVSTYGDGRTGVKALAAAIDEAKKADPSAGNPKPSKTKRSAPTALKADPLLV
jgi:hypothetical protein